MGFEPDDPCVLAELQIVGVMDDAHRIGLVEADTMIEADRGRALRWPLFVGYKSNHDRGLFSVRRVGRGSRPRDHDDWLSGLEAVLELADSAEFLCGGGAHEGIGRLLFRDGRGNRHLCRRRVVPVVGGARADFLDPCVALTNL